jgi:hypothetical protein
MFESFVWIIAIGTPSQKRWSDNVRWEIRKNKQNITLRRTKEVIGALLFISI